jgi:predicted dehydrogenase
MMTASAAKSGPTIGVAFVGSGFAATFHAENYRRVHGVNARLVGVFSRRYEAAQEFARTHGVDKAYRDLDELLADPEVDMVDTCVPPGSHEEMAVSALQAGKHVVVEKPFTGAFIPGKDAEGWQRCMEEAVTSANRMIEAERKSGRHIMYAENLVYAPGVQKARRLFDAADTPILRIIGEESHSGTHSPYAMEWVTSGGGSLYNKGCHLLGVALYLKDAEGMRRLGRPIRPSWVIAAVANLTRSEAFNSEKSHVIKTGWKDCEDWGTMVLGFDDGTVAQISAADTVVGGIQNLFTIYGAQAAVQINITPNNAVLAYAPDAEKFSSEYIREKVETTAGWQFTNPDEAWMNGFPHELQDFCEAATSGRKPQSGSALGWDVVAVGYAAYLSAATGRRVDVPTN